jgi:hypothetical protein
MLSTLLISAFLLGADPEEVVLPDPALPATKLRIAEASTRPEGGLALTTKETIYETQMTETLNSYPVKLPNGTTETRQRREKLRVDLPLVQTVRLLPPVFTAWRDGKEIHEDGWAELFKQPRQVVVVECDEYSFLKAKVLALFRPETLVICVPGVGQYNLKWEIVPPPPEKSRTLDLVPKERLAAERNSITNLPLSTGTFSPGYFAEVAKCLNIEYIWADQSAIVDADVARLTGLRKLKGINLGDTKITDDALTSLGQIRSLEDVCIGNTKVTPTGLAHLKDLKQLRLLTLGPLNLGESGMESIASHEELRDLTIDVRGAGGGAVPHLGKLAPLKKLEGLFIWGLSDECMKNLPPFPEQTRIEPLDKLTEAGVRELWKFPGLYVLDLRQRPLSDDALKALEGLGRVSEVNLSETGISDRGLVHLRNMRRLHTLRLAKTKITDNGLQLLANFPELEWLDLGDTAVTGSGLKNIKFPEKLTWLDLRNSKFTAAQFPALEKMRSLRNLTLAGTPVTDEMLAKIAKFSHLEQLFVDDTAVSDAGLKPLHALRDLNTLSVTGTNVTHVGSEEFLTVRVFFTDRRTWPGTPAPASAPTKHTNK